MNEASSPPDSPSSRLARRKARYALNVQTLVFTKGLEHFLSERTANISEGGIFVCTDYESPVGEKLHIRVILSDQDSYFDVKTRVAWVCDGEGGHPKGLGLEFVDLNEPQKRVIATVLKRYVNVQSR
jgi:uncharacterized protein (TIGR02266 family)